MMNWINANKVHLARLARLIVASVLLHLFLTREEWLLSVLVVLLFAWLEFLHWAVWRITQLLLKMAAAFSAVPMIDATIVASIRAKIEAALHEIGEQDGKNDTRH